MKENRSALVIVDPQNDFCDRRGSLYVDGAYDDIKRIASHVKSHGQLYTDIYVSLDSHDAMAIFHPKFWLNSELAHPAPFTRITAEDFKSGAWRPASDSLIPEAAQAFAAITAKEFGFLMVWPEHCLVSTWGHQIAGDLPQSLDHWRRATGRAVRYIFKGENPYTDQFSIFEGVDESRCGCAFNESLFGELAACGSVTFAGEALSHCVESSILSYAARADLKAQRVALLDDCSSPVAGFERGATLKKLEALGVSFVSSSSFD